MIMTPAELAVLRGLPLFPRSAEDLIRVVGIEAAARLIAAWPGQDFPVPKRIGGGNAIGTRRWEQLVEVVGEPAARLIVAYWGGSSMPIPNCKEVRWARQQNVIRADFDRLTQQEGYSFTEAVFELGITNGVTGRCIELVLKRPDNPAAPESVQGRLL